jgi:hypothetical protein
MAVNVEAAYAIYPHHVLLPNIVDMLNRAGIGNQDICMVLSPAHPISTAVRDANMFCGESEATALGARMIAWFSEFGAVVIPTVGFFIRSLEYYHALVMDQSNCSEGSGTLARLGFSAYDAEKLDYQLSEPGAMIYVTCRESARADWTTELLRHAGAKEAACVQGAKTIVMAAAA